MTEPYDAIKDIGHCPECGATGDYAELLKQRDELLAALRRLEIANDVRCGRQTPEAYQAALRCPRMQEALNKLDAARRAARALIARVEASKP